MGYDVVITTEHEDVTVRVEAECEQEAADIAIAMFENFELDTLGEHLIDVAVYPVG